MTQVLHRGSKRLSNPAVLSRQKRKGVSARQLKRIKTADEKKLQRETRGNEGAAFADR